MSATLPDNHPRLKEIVTGAEANTLCRGWAEVHEGNMSVRLAMFKVKWTEENNKPTKIPLYKSGLEARLAIEKIKSRRQKKAIR